jgi:hypothetical protein
MPIEQKIKLNSMQEVVDKINTTTGRDAVTEKAYEIDFVMKGSSAIIEIKGRDLEKGLSAIMECHAGGGEGILVFIGTKRPLVRGHYPEDKTNIGLSDLVDTITISVENNSGRKMFYKYHQGEHKPCEV